MPTHPHPPRYLSPSLFLFLTMWSFIVVVAAIWRMISRRNEGKNYKQTAQLAPKHSAWVLNVDDCQHWYLFFAVSDSISPDKTSFGVCNDSRIDMYPLLPLSATYRYRITHVMPSLDSLSALKSWITLESDLA